MKALFKKSLAVLLSAMLLLTAVPFAASAAEVTEESVGAKSGTTGNCTWTLDDNGNLTISGNGEMTNYGTGGRIAAPWRESIKSVVIQNGVTNIGINAFYGCTGLTSVTIGNSVTSIGDCAFYGCTGLTSITIPDSVTTIKEVAFSFTGLTNITVDSGNNVYDSRSNCNAIIETATNTLVVGCQTTVIPNSVTSIGDAFYECTGLTSVTIPDSVTSIGEYAFYDCTGLTSVTIPDSVTTIGEYAFYNTAWYNNQPDGLVYAGKVAYEYKGTMPNYISITLQDGTKGIAGHAFYNCTGLISITISDSVTSIGKYAFYGCSGLTSVTIPKSVISIEEKALGYYYNNGVKKVYNFTILGLRGSEAERYANDNGFIFIAVEKCPNCHSFLSSEQVITDPALPPTCLATGLTEGSHCSVCGEVITAQEVVPATGHSIVIDNAAAPTCTETGLTEGSHCSVCHEVITAQEEVPALGHKPVLDPYVAPTCQHEGHTVGAYCENCGEIYVAYEVIPKVPHTVVTDEAVAPSCGKTGLTEGSHCSVCGEIIVAQEVVPALSHQYEIVPAVPATYTKEGSTDGVRCKHCGEWLIEPQVVPRLPVDFIYGDSNNDGIINVRDITAIQRHLADLDTLTGKQLGAADTNCDGYVTIDDITLLQMYLAEYDVELG